jgi:hypothetical protein
VNSRCYNSTENDLGFLNISVKLNSENNVPEFTHFGMS